MQATAIDVNPYMMMTDEECEARIVEAKRTLGGPLLDGALPDETDTSELQR